MGLAVETPVGEIVAERLARARVLERLGIDSCCHGSPPLGEACVLRELDAAAVLAELAACDVDPDDDPTDYAAMSASALADHVEATHHGFVRQELPRLTELIEKVVVALGARHPELVDVRETFAGLREELEAHLMKEERVLFPLVRQLEQATAPFPMHCGTVDNPIRVMEHEHESAGAALERLRSLTGGYQTPPDGCASLQALYEGLAGFEADLHRHIHKENNLLFPRAAALEIALTRGQS